MSTERYRVVNGSESGHCCFQYSVVDTNSPEMDGDDMPMVIDGETSFKIVCECFEKDEAAMICKSLNKFAHTGTVE